MCTKPNIDLDYTINLFLKYLGVVKSRIKSEDESHLAKEALDRLHQMQWLLQRVSLISIRLQNGKPLTYKDFLMPIEMHPKEAAVIDEGDSIRLGYFITQMYVDSFYYLAARFRNNVRKGMPLLENFECKGIRDVRNLLIEHPEGKNSRVFNPTFDLALGKDTGPLLKVETDPGIKAACSDEGMFVNATEFKTNLDKLLEEAIEKLK